MDRQLYHFPHRQFYGSRGIDLFWIYTSSSSQIAYEMDYCQCVVRKLRYKALQQKKKGYLENVENMKP